MPDGAVWNDVARQGPTSGGAVAPTRDVPWREHARGCCDNGRASLMMMMMPPWARARADAAADGGVRACRYRGASTAPSPTWRFCIDAVPHTVLGTHAGTISRKVAFVHVAPAGPNMADAPPARLFLCAGCRLPRLLICSCCDRGPGLLRRRLRPASPIPHAASPPDGVTRPAVGGWLAHAERTRRYRAHCKKSDASRFTQAAAG